MTSLTIQHVENGYVVTQWVNKNEAGYILEWQGQPLHVYINVTDLRNDLEKLLGDINETTP